MLIRLSLVILLLTLGGFAWSQEPPKTPNVESQQQPESGLKTQEQNTEQTYSPQDSPLRVPEVKTESTEREGQSKTNERGKQGTEFWPSIHGHYRLKITDTLLVSVTFLLFLATLALWCSTRNLVRNAEETAKKQLRAYISIDRGGVRTLVTGRDVIGHIDIRNAGHVPARDLRIYIRLKISFDGKLRFDDFPNPTKGKRVIQPNTAIEQGSDSRKFWMALRALQNSEPVKNCYLYVWGKAIYRDGFAKEERFTSFVHRYNCRPFLHSDLTALESESGRIHEYGNDAD
jgi:hypothetical protein